LRVKNTPAKLAYDNHITSASIWGVDFGEKEGIKYQAESL
jgi:hypothetical protein